MANHYMIITTKGDYALDVKNEFKFLGFPERNKRTVSKFEKGDKVIIYVTKVSSFAAVVELTGKFYYDRSQVWEDDFSLYPYRVPCKVIKYISNFEDMVFIKEIWDDLEFIKTKHKWGAQVQGSLKILSEHDYKIIAASVIERAKSL